MCIVLYNVIAQSVRGLQPLTMPILVTSAAVLEDALSDHFPIMISLEIKNEAKKTSKLETIYRWDIAHIVT